MTVDTALLVEQVVLGSCWLLVTVLFALQLLVDWQSKVAANIARGIVP